MQGTEQTGEAKSFPTAPDGWRFGRDAAPGACCQLPEVRAVVAAVAEAGSWGQLIPGSLGCTGTQLAGPGANKAVKMLGFGAVLREQTYRLLQMQMCNCTLVASGQP